MSGVLTRARLIAQERFDLEDLIVDQNATKTDAKFWAKQFLSGENHILKGFEVTGLGLKAATIVMANATVIHPENTFDFSWFTAEESPTDIVVPDASLTDGVKNYLELRFVETTGTPVTKAFWDPAAAGGAGAEFNQEVDTITDLSVEVVVLTGGFSGSADRINLAIVEVDGSGDIVGILDKRDLLFEHKDFAWASQIEAETTLTLSGITGTFTAGEILTFSGGATATVTVGGTTTVKANAFSSDSFGDTNTVTSSGGSGTLDAYTEAFTGADKDIDDIKEAFDADRTEIKAIKGTDKWYEVANSSINGLLAISNQDRSISLLDEGSVWNWTLGTDTLAWSASLFLRVPGLANDVNEILTSSAVLDADGKAAYVEIKRTAGASTLTVNVADIAAIVPTPNLRIIAQRLGSEIIIDSKSFALLDTAKWRLREDLNIEGTTSSTTKDTGALVVEGGVGIEENLNIGGDQTIAGTTTSTTKDTGALVVEGGVGIEENLNIGGNVIVTGNFQVDGTTTTLNTQTVDVEDSNISVNIGGNQSAADTNDAGLKVEMSDATDAQLHYDSTEESKWKAGEVGSESGIITKGHTQTMTNKTLTAPAINAGVLAGATQLNDPIEEEIANDAVATGANATIATLPSPFIRLTNGSLTSVGALAVQVSGKVITLANVTGNTIEIEDNNGATAAQGILTGTGSLLSLPNDASISLKYDDTSLRWRIIGNTILATGNKSITTKTANYTTVSSDEVIFVDAISNDVTITLITAAGNPGKQLEVKRIDSTEIALDTFVDGDVTVGTDNINIATHPFIDLQRVQLTSSGTLPAGLSLATDYFIIFIDANNIKLASSRVNAIADTAVDITAAAGGGTHTVTSEQNDVVIDANGSELIDEDLTKPLETQNQSLKIISDNVNWKLIVFPFQQVAFIKNNQTSGTGGGSISANTWTDLVLNTVEGDTDILSLSANAFTLGNGDWLIESRSPVYHTSNTNGKSKLIDTSGPTDVIFGDSIRTAADNQVYTHLYHKVTISGSRTFKLQMRVAGALGANGLGFPVSLGTETYTTIKITKLK